MNSKLIAIASAGAGQAIMLLGISFSSRLVPAAALSQYAVLFSIFAIAQIVSSLRYDQAIVYENSDEGRWATYWLATIISPVVLAAFCMIAATYFYQNPQTNDIVVLALVALFVASSAAAVGKSNLQMIAAMSSNKKLAALNFLRPTLIGLFQLVAAFVGHNVTALFVALALSQVTYALISVVIMRSGAVVMLPNLAGLIHAFRRNAKFPKFSLPQNVLYTTSEALVPLSLPFLFSDQAAIALYWLASRAVFAPATIVSESIRPMIYKDLSVAGPRLFAVSLKYSLAMLLVPMLSVLTLAICGEFLFGIIFGAQWVHANDYAIALGVLICVNMFGLPAIGLLPIVNLQGTMLIVELVGLIIKAILILAFVWASPLDLVWAATVAYSLIIVTFVIYALSVARGFRSDDDASSILQPNQSSAC